jgi:TPR repeat protein
MEDLKGIHVEQGDATLQFNLGLKYAKGEDVEKDEAKAARLSVRGGGRAGPCRGAAQSRRLLRRRMGVAKDEAKAVRLYGQTAEQDYTLAQYSLGVCYDVGSGVEKDEAKAVRLDTQAAEQGLARAQFNLSLCYARGMGVAKDEAKAARLYAQAAKQGHAHAQARLGFCYGKGKGVEKDEITAARLYGQAAEQGHAGLGAVQPRYVLRPGQGPEEGRGIGGLAALAGG